MNASRLRRRREPILRRFFISVILVCIASTAPLPAQSYTHLAGVIRDPSAAAVPGATVTVVNEDTGFRRVTRSYSDGTYAVVSLEPGVYKITVRTAGFRTLIRLGVRLGVGQPARVDFSLPLGSMQESITVEGESAMLPTDDVSLGASITSEQIEKLPLNDRSLMSLIELAPGTIVTPATRGEAGQFTSDGQRPNTNYFSIDGVSVNTGVSAGGLPAQNTGGALPGMTALGSLHSLISLDAIDEFRVQTSTTAPEFGRLPGAQITLTSRSGSNEFHGSAYDYHRGEALEANDWFSNRQGQNRAPTQMNDFGGSMGGPARRNRTFFFLSYEGMRLRQPFSWRATVPAPAIRDDAPPWIRPLLNLFPIPNGQELGPGLAEWTGGNTRPGRFDAANVRIDHALTSRIALFGRYNQTPSWSDFNGAQVNHIAMGSRGLTFGANVRLRPSAVIDLRVNSSEASLRSSWGSAGSSPCDLKPVVFFLLRAQDACNYLLRFSIAGVGQVVSGPEADQRQAQSQVASALVMSVGTHQMHFGADYLRLTPTRHDTARSLGVIAESLSGLVAGTNLWTAVAEPQSRYSILKEGSVFFQDTWRVHRNLTASFGLRWEFTPPPELKLILSPFQSGPPQLPLYIFSSQKTIWRRNYANLGPRVGLAYRPFAKSTTVLRAGWGIYYDSSLSIATDVVNGGPFSLSQYANATHAPFSQLLSYGFMPGLRLPSVAQWSGSVEHMFGTRQLLSLAYAGSAGRQLLRRELGGFQDTQTLRVALATNNGSSRYHALQAQYRLTLAHGLSGLASYSWSHSIDNSSSDSVLHWVGSGLGALQDRGSSDFDVRHAFTAAVSYEMPHPNAGSLQSSLMRGWGLDGILHARTGFPITVLNTDYSMGMIFANFCRRELVHGHRFWLNDSSVHGGRRL
ncbi:MAG: TonB-dependent receptor, plug, partial [Bryobacterales bacterium]|nr:TonB-dependent receptor, plug [Bryobacterales bacterium]